MLWSLDGESAVGWVDARAGPGWDIGPRYRRRNPTPHARPLSVRSTRWLPRSVPSRDEGPARGAYWIDGHSLRA